MSPWTGVLATGPLRPHKRPLTKCPKIKLKFDLVEKKFFLVDKGRAWQRHADLAFHGLEFQISNTSILFFRRATLKRMLAVLGSPSE